MSTPDLTTQVVDYVEGSGRALLAAQQLASQVANDRVKIAQAVPAVVEALRARQLIRDGEVKIATDRLSSHTGALEIIQSLLGQLDDAVVKQAADSGGGRAVPATQPARVKRAGDADSGQSGGYVARRRGAGEVSEADLALIRTLGIENQVFGAGG